MVWNLIWVCLIFTFSFTCLQRKNFYLSSYIFQTNLSSFLFINFINFPFLIVVFRVPSRILSFNYHYSTEIVLCVKCRGILSHTSDRDKDIKNNRNYYGVREQSATIYCEIYLAASYKDIKKQNSSNISIPERAIWDCRFGETRTQKRKKKQER